MDSDSFERAKNGILRVAQNQNVSVMAIVKKFYCQNYHN